MNYHFDLNAGAARSFWQSNPDYKKTPLNQIYDPKHQVNLWIKNEAVRLNLKSFKAMGGIYATAKMIFDHIKKDTNQTLDFNFLQSTQAKIQTKDLHFACASAGNHGLAVATAASLFGAKATILLSETVPNDFELRLKDIGADVLRAGVDYEASVAAAIEFAEKEKAILLADGAWEGYTEPPRLVMEGYGAIALEMMLQFKNIEDYPSHVFLQAGVGGLAGAMAYMIRTTWPIQPKIYIVEPDQAPCLKISAAHGELYRAEGGVSNMGRLDCKDASLIAFDILSKSDVEYIEVTDQEADDAVDQLSVYQYPTSPSGGAGYAGLTNFIKNNPEIAKDKKFKPLIIISETKID